MNLMDAGQLQTAFTAEPLSFELFAFRLRFRALESLYFPPGKAGNVIRGALGQTFKKFVCRPNCPGARTCEQRYNCAYACLFEPTARIEGPSGLADWPRPFVIRAAHLDGRRLGAGETFHFDFSIFELRDPALAYFAFSFSQLLREGMGPGRAATELTAIHELDGMRQEHAQIFDGHTLLEQHTITLSLEAETQPVHRAEVRFLTPTELKGTGQILRTPDFGVLFARSRDRIHTLRQIYGRGPLPLDFTGLGERARLVKLVRSNVQWQNPERRSGRTGQTHSLGGFVGSAEYEGDLAEFLPYLRAASWTGVGRQTTWGKGHIEIRALQ
ncbi:MAG TPA: CRISPR system precrRNA processing endoribonuclease RAMP protein Cas6 [Candidatus Angelobacter sp.]|nr:CRISPR system precrRNA processing endoribonuclease RAMP protein Cas6 [Candidatus Angelobacter sp.]